MNRDHKTLLFILDCAGIFVFALDGATAALARSTAMILALRAQTPVALTSLIGAAACFTLRMLRVWHHWNLPKLIPN